MAKEETKKIKTPFTAEQEAIMELANKYNQMHKDMMNIATGLQSIPVTQNMMMAIARRAGLSAEGLAEAIRETTANKKYEEDSAKYLRKISDKKIKTFNKQLIKKRNEKDN